MPNYEIRDDGRGPYAVFYCDACAKPYPSTPIPSEIAPPADSRGLMSRIRHVRDVLTAQHPEASSVPAEPQMTPEQVQDAWEEVRKSFRECPTCRQVMCVADFDETTGFCRNDSPAN
jgi:hypothetical protein